MSYTRLIRIVFPKLADRSWAEINLDSEARKLLGIELDIRPKADQCPPCTEEYFEKLLADVHARLGVQYSFGGYLEDRRFLLGRAYLAEHDRFIHLGVDFDVPAGTKICSPCEAVVLHCDDDKDPDGGWGPRVFLQPTDPVNSGHVLLYAHLGPVQTRVGQCVKAGELFCEVGAPPGNGNWSPHLHLQAIESRYAKNLLKTQVFALDGYCTEAERNEMSKHCPNPISVLLQIEENL